MSFPEVEPRLFSFNSPYGACPNCNGLGTKSLFSDEPCPVCHGERLRPEALRVYLKSSHKKANAINLGSNIVNFTSLSIRDAKDFLDSIELNEFRREVAEPIINIEPIGLHAKRWP